MLCMACGEGMTRLILVGFQVQRSIGGQMMKKLRYSKT
jgi:hypothetical protein